MPCPWVIMEDRANTSGFMGECPELAPRNSGHAYLSGISSGQRVDSPECPVSLGSLGDVTKEISPSGQKVLKI